MSFLQDITSHPASWHTRPDLADNDPSSSKPSVSGAGRLSWGIGLRKSIQNLGGTFFASGSTQNDLEEKHRRKLHERKQVLYLRMKDASSYDEWRSCATELDDLEGNNAWKDTFESDDYDPRYVETCLDEMDEARLSCDVGRMLHLVRTALSRDLGSMSNPGLYKHSHIGTKSLVDRYISSTIQTLDALLGVSERRKCDSKESKYMLDQLLLARQAFGRTALMLSGGATFGMNHIGVVKALHEANLLPRIINGASAGSIICAVLCIHTDDELPGILESFAHGDLAAFGPPDGPEGILVQTARFLKQGSLLDSSHLIRLMKGLVGDLTFQEAYYRTRRILNICVSSASGYEQPRLLNYITAPNVLIWSAVAASCSVPILFTASSIFAKDSKTGEHVPWNPSFYVDGSVDNDIPTVRLSEMFNVNHFIVSQVNPHIVPFLRKDDGFVRSETTSTAKDSSMSGEGVFDKVLGLAKDEALFRLHVLSEFGVFPGLMSKAISLLSQKYSGDINIFPHLDISHYARMIQNPTPEFMLAASLCGERATWPRMSRIRNSVAIELALDRAVQEMRARATFSGSMADFRALQSAARGRRVSRTRKRRKSHGEHEFLPQMRKAGLDSGLTRTRSTILKSQDFLVGSGSDPFVASSFPGDLRLSASRPSQPHNPSFILGMEDEYHQQQQQHVAALKSRTSATHNITTPSTSPTRFRSRPRNKMSPDTETLPALSPSTSSTATSTPNSQAHSLPASPSVRKGGKFSRLAMSKLEDRRV